MVDRDRAIRIAAWRVEGDAKLAAQVGEEERLMRSYAPAVRSTYVQYFEF